MSTPGSPAPTDSPVLLDTDVVSALFFGGLDAARYDTAVSGREMLLSSFSQGEVLAGAAMREWGPRRMDELERLLGRMVVLEVTENVVRGYASVRAEAKRIGHPLHGPSQSIDRWIAATALAYQVPLLTGNRKHFDGFPGLELVEVA